MSRYFTRARGPVRADWWYDNGPLLPNMDVPEHIDTDTGLVDSNGETIWRAPNPVGFGRDSEW